MSVVFPVSPAPGATVTDPDTGTVWIWDGTKWTHGPGGAAGGGANVHVGPTPPASPAIGDLWFDSVGLRLFVRFSDGVTQWWVVANPDGGGGDFVTQEQLADALAGQGIHTGDNPPSNPAEGDLWYDVPNTTLKVYRGGVWVAASETDVSGFLPLSGGTVTGNIQLANFWSRIIAPVGNALQWNMISEGSGSRRVATGPCGQIYEDTSGRLVLGSWPSGAAGSVVGTATSILSLNTSPVGCVISARSTHQNGINVGSGGIIYSAFPPENQIGFQWTGNLVGWVNSTPIGNIQYTPSDERLKERIGEVERDALAALGKVTLHSFDRLDPVDRDNPPVRHEIGFIAQQLREIIPEAVLPGEILSLDLVPLVASCVRAIQQLLSRVEALEGARR